MNKLKFFKWAICFILILGEKNMNAQTKLDTKNLTQEQSSLVIISALTATGNLAALKPALNTALDAGLSINKIKEELVQLYAYCGFPRSLNAINTLMAVVEERKAKGITDKQDEEIITKTGSDDKYEQGRKVLEKLTGAVQVKPAPGFGEFAPRIDAFLKEHLFADVFESDVLSYKERELITISALAAMYGVEAQLQAHIKMGMVTGVTETQLNQIAGLIEKHVSKAQANTLNNLLGQPLLPLTAADMMVRISEIEIFPQHLEEYKAILKEESAVSVNIEPGVIALFAMYQKENPAQVRILEIYADKDAYQSHLKTPHFQHYKTSTVKMVKSLKLVDMNDVDTQAMVKMFKKLN